jgi:hypothetical protein
MFTLAGQKKDWIESNGEILGKKDFCLATSAYLLNPSIVVVSPSPHLIPPKAEEGSFNTRGTGN